MLRVAERWGTARPSTAQLREETMSSFYISDETVDEGTAGGVDVFAAGGEIDYAASPLLDEHIARHIKAGTRHLVIDLSAATFIDSTAIGVLMGAVGRLRESCGGTLAVVCVDENVLKILEISGLQAAIAIYRTREEALSALALVA
jgi:anti-sigma B factor antagonist